MTRDQMQKIWQQPDCRRYNAICEWINGKRGWTAIDGRACNTSPGKSALEFRRKWLTHDDYPAWSVLSRHTDIEPSKELKARYKADCPNNYKALIDAYGKTRTNYDAPLPGEYHDYKGKLTKWSNAKTNW